MKQVFANLVVTILVVTHPATVRRSIFLSDPVRPVGGVEDADGVHDARPSVLYAPTGP